LGACLHQKAENWGKALLFKNSPTSEAVKELRLALGPVLQNIFE